MQPIGSRFLLAAALVFALVHTPAPAHALTLGELVGGASFTTGGMTFDDFEATPAGSVGLDLDAYAVQILADGFRLSGPVSALLGEAGALLLSYTVTSAVPDAIVGASLFADGVTIGAGSVALVAESLFDAGNSPLATLVVYDVAGVGEVVLASASFAGSSVVSVAKAMQVETGTFAWVPFVEQRFLVVAEPMTLFLLGSGMAGLVFGGRRRALQD